MNMLRNIRERKGLTVRELAARSSIPSRLLTEYEEGRQPLPLAHAKRIAQALWVQVEDLIPPAGTTPPVSAPPPPQPSYPQPQPQVASRPVAQAPYPDQAARGTEFTAPTTQPPVSPPPVQTSAPFVRSSAPAQPQANAEYRATAPRHDTGTGPRTSDDGQRHRPGKPGLASRGVRPAPPPPSPITEGQMQELVRLAARLEVPREQLEERIGKSLSSLTRPEAKEWVKRVRAMADEIAPTHKVRYGQWPGGQEDREAAYLREQQNGGNFTFKLFNGEQFNGTIADFTPYTITIRDADGSETVLRKLAIAYYRISPNAYANSAETKQDEPQPKKSSRAKAAPQEAAPTQRDDVDSNHAGAPDNPETDNMDEDRGV